MDSKRIWPLLLAPVFRREWLDVCVVLCDLWDICLNFSHDRRYGQWKHICFFFFYSSGRGTRPALFQAWVPHSPRRDGAFVLTLSYHVLPTASTKPALDTFPEPWLTLRHNRKFCLNLSPLCWLLLWCHMILWGRQKETKRSHFQFLIWLLGPHLSYPLAPSNQDFDWPEVSLGSLNTGLKTFCRIRFLSVSPSLIIHTQETSGYGVRLVLGFRGNNNSSSQSRGLSASCPHCPVAMQCAKAWKQSNPVGTVFELSLNQTSIFPAWDHLTAHIPSSSVNSMTQAPLPVIPSCSLSHPFPQVTNAEFMHPT